MAVFNTSGNITVSKDRLIIDDKYREKNSLYIFRMYVGILIGPTDFLMFEDSIDFPTSSGTVGLRKNGLLFTSRLVRT